MKNLKKFLAVLLTVAMMASVMLVPAFAEGEELTAVEQVGILGLLKGDGEGLTDEYLSQNLTRMQVAILYARLIGIEEDAYAFDAWDEDTNFADYDDDTSAKEENMLAFFYDDSSYGFIGTDMDEDLGLMKFEPQSLATNKELVKILLTAMDYPYGDQYDWSDILSFARSVGIDLGTRETQINMNDVAEAIVMALESKMDDGTVFAQYLIDEGILDAEKVAEAGIKLIDDEDATDEIEPAVYEVKSVAANNFAEIELTFNYKIDADSVKKENIKVDGTKLAGADRAYVVSDYGDGAVLRVFVLEGFVGAQNEKRTISVTGVKTPKGTTMTAFSQEVMFRDSSAPTIEKVVAKGNSRLDIYLSEPLLENLNDVRSLSNYKVNGKSISGSAPEYKLDSDKNTGRLISLKKINNVLAAGEYELSITGGDTKFVDYAGNNMGYQSATFTIVDDKEGPIAQEVLSPVYPAKVQIKFDEEITEDATIYWNDNGKKKTSNTPDIDEDDPTIATFEFDDGKQLPFTSTTIYLQDCKDYSGNAAQAPTSFVVTAVADSGRPEVVDYGSDEEQTFWVKFSKKIYRPDTIGEYTIKDSGGDRVYDIKSSIDPDDSKIVVFDSTSDTLDADTYTVTLKNFEDTALPDRNKMLETTIEVTIPDTEAPVLQKAWWDTDSATSASTISVYFNEKVDSSSAYTRSNYKTIDTAGKATSLSNTTSINLASGERLVKIDVSKLSAADREKMYEIQVSDIEDLEANKAAQQKTKILTRSEANEAEVKEVKATSTTKIKVYTTDLTSGIASYDVSDFTLYEAGTSKTSKVGITKAELNSEGTELSLYLDKELKADATYNGVSLDLYMRYLRAVDSNTGNATISTLSVADGIKASNTDAIYGRDSSYTYSTVNTISVLFDEEVFAESGDWNDVFGSLVIDGKTRTNGQDGYAWTYSKAANDDDYYVRIHFTGTTKIDDVSVEVIYLAIPGKWIVDHTGGNGMNSFSTKITNVRYIP